jgi:hypothetical protein
MAHIPKDINSVVALVKSCHSRIVNLDGSSLTSIQHQQSEARFRQSLYDEGITYDIHSHYDAEPRLACAFRSLYVRDSGVITDVSPTGRHPIRLSISENISVHFEPRDISQIPSWKHNDLDNTKFANLNKGSSFSFAGRLIFCDYFFNRLGGAFVCQVDSEYRPPMLVTDWVRKLWNGSLPGIDFVR